MFVIGVRPTQLFRTSCQASALEVKSETRKALEEQLKRSSLFANVQVSEPQASGTYYFDVQSTS